jgi:Ni/Co efflux regulator RcnB
MKKSNPNENSGVSKVRQVLFTFLAFGFTLISLWNGFTFHRVLFGLFMAILISSVFEIARIACLYNIMSSKRVGMLSVFTYIIVASVCACAAVSSFTYEVIKRDQQNKEYHIRQIRDIKKAYSRKIEKELSVIKRDIQKAEHELAKRPWSGYWKRSHAQAITNRDHLITQRDKFLGTEPSNPEHWINSKAPLLGIKREEPKRDTKDLRAVTTALKELWGLDRSAAKKIAGIVITITVELSIIILAFLGSANAESGKRDNRDKRGKRDRSSDRDKSKNVTKKSTGKKKSLESVMSDIEGEVIEKFLEANRTHFEKTGKLLPLRKLSPVLRPVRKAFENLNKEDLEKYFEA